MQGKLRLLLRHSHRDAFAPKARRRPWRKFHSVSGSGVTIVRAMGRHVRHVQRGLLASRAAGSYNHRPSHPLPAANQRPRDPSTACACASWSSRSTAARRSRASRFGGSTRSADREQALARGFFPFVRDPSKLHRSDKALGRHPER